jgi:excisionase family DNA binding protein
MGRVLDPLTERLRRKIKDVQGLLMMGRERRTVSGNTRQSLRTGSVIMAPEPLTLDDLQLYTVPEAAKVLAVSAKYLYKLVAERRVPWTAGPGGKSVRFSASNLRDIIEHGYRPVVTR